MTNPEKFPSTPESDPKLVENVSTIKHNLELLQGLNNISLLQGLNSPMSLDNTVSLFRGLRDSLEEISKVKPEFSQQINSLLEESGINYIVESGEKTGEVLHSISTGTEEIEGEKNKRLLDFGKKIMKILPEVLKQVETFLKLSQLIMLLV